MSVIDDYKIEIINGIRYYKFDLYTKTPVMEHTIPFCFRYNSYEIYEKTWGKMTLKILQYFDDINPKTKSQLLALKYNWSSSAVFSETPRINFAPFKGLYLNINHTATHSMMAIQMILNEYNVNLSCCAFLFKPHHVAEPIVSKRYFREMTIAGFKKYLISQGNSEKRADVIINNYVYINKILEKTSSSFNDFFLFDDYSYFLNYKSSVLNKAKLVFIETPKLVNAIDVSLRYLESYYKNKIEIDKIANTRHDNLFITTLKREIEELFKVLDSDVISVAKLYDRMAAQHNSMIEDFRESNKGINFGLFCSYYLGKDYYFSQDKYIARDKMDILSKDELVIKFIRKHDELTAESVKNYAVKMNIDGYVNVMELMLSQSDDYILISNGKMISKKKMVMPDYVIDNIKDTLVYYINSFGEIDSESFIGYTSLPKSKIEWNKYFLLGLVNTFLKDFFVVNYKTITISNVKYTIGLL